MAIQQPTATRFYAPDHPALTLTLRSRIEQLKNEQSQQIADGFASDWADYKHRAGIVLGLTLALGLCAEAEKDLQENRR